MKNLSKYVVGLVIVAVVAVVIVSHNNNNGQVSSETPSINNPTETQPASQPAPSPSPSQAPKTQKQVSPGPGNLQKISWVYPQACPQYGAPKSCYVPEGAFGGYDSWAKNKAAFFWQAPPGCFAGKKLVAIKDATCTYETAPFPSASAQTAISPDGLATVDCRAFAAQFKSDACNCNNGITLKADFFCE